VCARASNTQDGGFDGGLLESLQATAVVGAVCGAMSQCDLCGAMSQWCDESM
jgi:hypothetical protein